MIRCFSTIIGPLIVLLMLVSCASTAQNEEETIAPPQIRQTRPFVADAFLGIAKGSPESLREAFEILDSRDNLSQYALDLQYLSAKLYSLLYSSLPEKLPEIAPPQGSYFASLIQDITRGVYPVVRMEESSYLFFILPPMSILYSPKNDTLNTAYESLTVGRELNPKGTLPQFLLGYVEEKRKNNAEAITWYISALQTSVTCYPAAFGLARIYISAERYTEASLVLSEAAEVIESDPELLYLQGKIDLADENYDEALNKFNEAEETGGKKAEYSLGAAEARYKKKQNNEALQRIEESRRLGGDETQAALLEATILRAMDQRLRALTVLRDVREVNPDNNELNELYRQLLLETGRSEETRIISDSVLEGYSPEASRYILLMEHAIDSGLWREARIYFEQVLTHARNPEVLETGVRIYDSLGMNDDALSLLDELYEARPENPEYPLRIMEIAIKAGYTERAADAIDNLEGMDLNPGQKSRLKVVQARLARGTAAERSLLEEALFLDVRNTEALYFLAEYHLRIGEKRRALMYIRQIERTPGLPREMRDRVLTLKENAN